MTPLQHHLIQPGVRFATPIFTRQGIKVIGAGVTLTQDMCVSLRQLLTTETSPGHSDHNLFLAATLAEMRAAGVLRKKAPKPGSFSKTDLVTRGGHYAAAAGETLEPHHTDALSHGAFTNPHLRESRRARAARLRIADAIVAQRAESWTAFPVRTIPAGDAHPIVDLSNPADSPWPDANDLGAIRNDQTDAIRKIYAQCFAGVNVDLAAPAEVIDTLLTLLVQNPARFPEIALGIPQHPGYLPDHVFTTTALCLLTASRMNWSIRDVKLAGLSGMFADLGMLTVPDDALTAPRTLTDIELNYVWRHPTASVVLTESIQGLPEVVRRAVYQHHERGGAAGYPNRIDHDSISDLAHVVAACDAFAAATAPRAYKPGKLPFNALRELIELAQQGLYNKPTVKTLVRAVGLFPVSSCVSLNDIPLARVVATNPDRADRPRIMPLATDGSPGTNPIDLADERHANLRVLAPVQDPNAELLIAA